MNRAEELKRRIRKAGMSPGAVVVFDTLADHTAWGTGMILGDYQPRSVAELADWCGLSKPGTVQALNLLDDFGWVLRSKPAVLRYGLSTTYQIAEGRQRRTVKRPMTDSERSRHYRARKKASVTTEVVRNSDKQSVTNAQVNGTFVHESANGGGSSNGRSLPASILRIVSDPRWGGGVHREHLAELLVYKPGDRDLVGALMYLYRRKRIDFCGQYVVIPSTEGKRS